MTAENTSDIDISSIDLNHKSEKQKKRRTTPKKSVQAKNEKSDTSSNLNLDESTLSTNEKEEEIYSSSTKKN